MKKSRIVVLVSGSGSNLQVIIDKCEQGLINGEVVAVISNVEKVYALERAYKHNIPSHTLTHTAFETREAFDHELQKIIEKYSPDLITLAGFMRILTPNFVAAFAGKMLNLHPSLLPKYPGLNTHKRALENADDVHGASIHFVTSELDGGPVVLQSAISIMHNDTPETLAKKVSKCEWLIYPMAIKWFCEGRLRLHQERVWLDNKKIIKTGLIYEKLDSKEFFPS
ncbi:phosphoribosylglycinamide formyltransferase [Glaciecola petra]|uniref:Phosphoribosylglycinamide formyltransferase n=1 Tax=Glaciecola petra TaxID=3075602 RepID=A0ABU2ZPG4_9ALTE|nr:phosphoribosylglycinamide formyltransferase [Aestuariibacter sp. P117]MDT0594306.1 phosphoribosylglycinamide formyltransferase [Aestuariibacter sp. P117]